MEGFDVTPVLSIVMPIYLAKPILAWMTDVAIRLIKERTVGGFELVIVDDGSPSPAIDFGKHKYIRRNNQGGFAEAVNEGVGHTCGQFICIINNDLFVHWGWDVALVGEASRRGIGFAFPAARHIPDQAMAYGAALGEAPVDHAPVDCDMRGVFGACFVSRRSVFDELGPLDEGYGPGGWEDKDLFACAIERGYRLRKCFDSHVVHIGNATANTVPGFWKAQANNCERFEAAHGPISKWGLE